MPRPRFPGARTPLRQIVNWYVERESVAIYLTKKRK
jgi:hypothetical protein